MTRVAAGIVVLTLGTVTPLDAELKITSRTTVKAATTKPSAEAPDPMLAMFGEMTLQLVSPNGQVDMTAIVGARATRIEYAQATLGLEPGTVMLVQQSGDIVVLNSKNKTYWKTTSQEAADMWRQLDAQPKQAHKRTGEFQTIAGVRAERITFDWSIEFSGASTPMKMNGDLWVADRYKQYAPLAVRTNLSLAPFGMTSLLSEGVVLKSILRSPTFGGKEIETIVTSITEAPAPAGALEIPAGYKQVPAPGGNAYSSQMSTRVPPGGR
jgi:hypothetical protein